MLEIAISPCPNDTFLFYAWIAGLVGKDLPCKPTFADIETLNRDALENKFPLIKVSIAAMPKIQKDYTLLPVGCALGHGCGPLLVGKKAFSKVAIPGAMTTAHRLFDIFFPGNYEKVFCFYHEVEELIKTGSVDAGLLIHETRFTHSLNPIADLGKLWEERFELPIPLGGIAAHKTLPHARLTAILSESLEYAQTHPKTALPFILEHAQDKREDVVAKHIELYVTEETGELSASGKRAIKVLLSA